MELDSLKNNMQPIVRMVDNFYKNRNLGLLFEVKAGDGKLLVCSSDLAKNLNTRPVARQLRYSLLKYMESDKFNPQEEVAFKQIKQVLHNVNRTKEVNKSSRSMRIISSCVLSHHRTCRSAYGGSIITNTLLPY